MLGAGLHAVASYLGITPAQLRSGLAAGKSLARIAQEHGKTAAGLVDELVGLAKSRLDKAVSTKRLTSAQEQSMLRMLRTVVEGLVSGKWSALTWGAGGVRPSFGLGLPRHHGGWSAYPAPQL
jgi:hypothetical protein